MYNDKQLAQLAEPHHRGEAREIAAIDLGSNSFHMLWHALSMARFRCFLV